MNIISLQQGSDAWHQFRATHFGASEAAAMLGLSESVTRSELIMRKATGVAREYSEWFQENILDRGHTVEALARPMAEEIIGEDLFPITFEEGDLSYSSDGATMDERTLFECKSWNSADADMVEDGILPEKHMPQCQQGLMIARAERLLFMITDGTPNRMAWMWVYPADGWPERLRAGWNHFKADVAAYVPTVTEAKAVGRTMDSLPALRVLVRGEVTETNVDQWAEIARAVLGSINRTLNTDQDFADAEQAIKWCEKQEGALEAAKQHALSQTETIDKLFKTIDAIKEETRAIRLEQEKLVTHRKSERKSELVSEAAAAWHAFVNTQNEALAPYKLPLIAADFPAQIKNKRNFASMKDALDTELARAKIAATDAAIRIAANAKVISAHADYAFLFSDAAALVLKDAEALTAIVQNRITQHEVDVKRKAEEAAEREREKIRAEERARAEAEERERQAKAQREREEEAAHVAAVEAAERRRQDEESQRERAQAAKDLAALEPTPAERRAETVASAGLPAMELYRPLSPWPATAPAPTPSAKTPKSEDATLNLGALGERWGCVIGSKFISSLGVEPRKIERGSCLYSEGDWIRILRAIADRAERMLIEAGDGHPIPF